MLRCFARSDSVASCSAPALVAAINERCDGSQESLVVKVHTDTGLVGIGEVDSSSLVARAIIEAPLSHKICRGLAECVVGHDPFEIDRLIHRMYEGSIFYGRQGAALQAMSGVEIALWDIVGKATGRPAPSSTRAW